MIRFFGQMMMLPVTALTTGIDVFTRAVKGVQHTDESTPGRRPGEAGGRPAGRDRADDGASMDDEEIKLVEYTIVSLKRGDEQIVDRGQTVVSKRMSPEAFSSRLLDDVSRKRRLGSAESKQLRVYFQVLTRWPRRKRSGAA